GTDPAPSMLTPEEVVAQLRTMRDRIPDFTQLPTSTSRSLVPVGSLTREFTLKSIHITGASQVVQDFVGTAPEAMLQNTSDDDRWSAVEEELRAMLKGVIAANLARRHRLGSAALLAYGISQQLVRKPEHANLIPHVEELKRLKRLGRRKPV